MISFIQNLRARYRWTWVGTVEGRCRWADYGVTDYVYWNLFERADGRRKALVTGDPKWSNSGHVASMKAAVDAWIRGAPLPPLVRGAELPKPKAKLFVFPGGAA